ncbi:MAG TPA: hypothetical protein VKR24_01525 [Candidatus Limnocylindrales bacterium]|nr:hypothetical protein [Candidatus Limnocylindrales bacterium]
MIQPWTSQFEPTTPAPVFDEGTGSWLGVIGLPVADIVTAPSKSRVRASTNFAAKVPLNGNPGDVRAPGLTWSSGVDPTRIAGGSPGAPEEQHSERPVRTGIWIDPVITSWRPTSEDDPRIALSWATVNGWTG